MVNLTQHILYRRDKRGRLSYAVLVVALAMIAGCRWSRNNAYPNRPIKLIVPFAPGGGTDVFARILKRAIDDHQLLARPLVIVNIEGAGGTIGSRRVKNAKPDGYTFMLLHEAILTAQASGTVNYGPEVFEVISGTGVSGMVVAVAEQSPHQSLTQLMAGTVKRPDSIRFGANLGALSHFVGLQLESKQPGARFRFVQAGGGAMRFADLKGGHIDVTSFSLEEFMRYRADGLRGLALLDVDRYAAVPDVPTAREQGLDIVMASTFYWWAPMGTPTEITSVLATALKNAMQTDDVQQKLKNLHCQPIFLQGKNLAARLARSTGDFANVSARPTVDLPNIPAIVFMAIVCLSVFIALEKRPGKTSDGHLAS